MLNKPKVGDALWGGPLNDTLDSLDGSKASTNDIAVLQAQIDSLKVALFGIIVPQNLIFRYEEGTNGEALTPGNDILSVDGVVIYSNVANMHGLLGLRRGLGVHGTWTYANPSVLQSSGSVYFRVITKGPADQTLFDYTSSLAQQGAQVVLRGGGTIQLILPNGSQGEASITEWEAGKWHRLDWQQSWDGSQQHFNARFFKAPESDIQDDELSGVWDSPLPDQIRFLKSNDAQAWAVDVDTYRAKNSLDWYMPYDPEDPGFKFYNYDDGTNGAAVPSGVDDVLVVGGNPTFSTTGAPPNHDTLYGVQVPATTNGGTLQYQRISSATETGSIYVFLVGSGASSSKLVVWENDSGNRQAAINIGTAKKLAIQDGSGTNVVSGNAAIPLSQWVRIDWKAVYDSVASSIGLEVKLFTTAESDGVPTEDLATSSDITVAAEPTKIQFGSTSNDWNYYFSGVRLWEDKDDWPGPLGPPAAPTLPPGTVAWAGDSSQTDAYITLYTDTIASIGLNYSVNSDMTSSTPVAGTATDIYGFRKIHLTGLTAGTTYYYRITDAGAETGPTRKFRTLKAVGTPCTIAFAVGSCKQDNPASNNTFNDIINVTVDPTRAAPNSVPLAVMDFINLGDLGYPGNLSTALSTHAFNWSFNITDAALEIVQQKMNHKYIISDHDVNGGETKIGNSPNLNDPVTKTNIQGWQLWIPAVMDDTRNFFQDGDGNWHPGARYRSVVEGHVRYIFTDIRNLERSDVLTVPADPQAGKPGHGSPTTMLGTTQLNWLKGQLDLAATNREFVVLYTDSAWNGLSPVGGDGFIPATFTDKWPSYCYERDVISDYAFSKIGENMVILHGDSHGMQFDDGQTPKFDGSGNRLNDKNGYVVACCGPFNQNLHMHYTNAYDWSYPANVGDGQTGGVDTGPYRKAMQWVYLYIDEPSGTPFTFNVELIFRDASTVKSGGNPPWPSGTPKTVFPTGHPTGWSRTYTT